MLYLVALAFLAAPDDPPVRYQCVGRAAGPDGSEAHAVLFVNARGEREDGIVSWSPPAKESRGLPFTVDLLYGMGSLETGTYFDPPAQVRMNVMVALDPAPSTTLKAAIATPTSGSRIVRPWQVYDQAVAQGVRRPIEGTVTFAAGDGSDGVFYAIEDKDPTLTLKLIGDGGAVVGKKVFDLTGREARDGLVARAFAGAAQDAADPKAACKPAD